MTQELRLSANCDHDTAKNLHRDLLFVEETTYSLQLHPEHTYSVLLFHVVVLVVVVLFIIGSYLWAKEVDHKIINVAIFSVHYVQSSFFVTFHRVASLSPGFTLGVKTNKRKKNYISPFKRC